MDDETYLENSSVNWISNMDKLIYPVVVLVDKSLKLVRRLALVVLVTEACPCPALHRLMVVIRKDHLCIILAS